MREVGLICVSLISGFRQPLERRGLFGRHWLEVVWSLHGFTIISGIPRVERPGLRLEARRARENPLAPLSSGAFEQLGPLSKVFAAIVASGPERFWPHVVANQMSDMRHYTPRGCVIMAESATSSFNCPNCKALYRVVKVLPGPETVDRELTCRSCGAPLPARDGGLILKYFMLRKAADRQAWRELPARVSRVR
jgi:predicted RNA-binding Zn-ribbon protein involved in translation (DUF1610 family)